MSEVQLHTTELATQYVTQVAADLERNAEERARISAELEALQERLRTLQHDHGVLVNIQQALTGSSSAGAAPTVPPQASAVPQRSKSKKAAAESAKKTATPKTSPAKASKTTVTAAAQPSLVDLVRGHLEQAREPRSTAEITAALTQAHPNRSIKTTVVRTTVENLVAKNLAQRTKQGSSVFYVAEAAASAQPAAAAAS